MAFIQHFRMLVMIYTDSDDDDYDEMFAEDQSSLKLFFYQTTVSCLLKQLVSIIELPDWVSIFVLSFKKTKDLKSLGIGEHELEELDWGKTSNLMMVSEFSETFSGTGH